ncbi:MAG: PleD family two-component system response regulator [Leptolyngbyaceae cyanobacterium RM2_2_4]|nr:PleD family two-component system response regulator [Leptolyngbyaceae cyanobacterium SM1_4_3]NJO49106.1 PleD family two-component system response regulator [Leptolyngbyaceae cyanobacterium RM2_2_4]
MNKALLQHKTPLILIVDDDQFARMQLRLSLEREGYQTIEAQNGREAFTVFEQQQPDLVLLDALMPELNGFECCAWLQTLPQGKDIPILMITGLDDQASVDYAFEVGAADYVTKPIHWAVLRQRVRRLIQQSQLQRQQVQLQQQLEAVNRDLQRLVSTDGLTQVANRRRFDEALEQEQRRIRRSQFCTIEDYPIPLSLILCDIDHFKLYNDTYGHQAGDRCLQQVAQAISAVTSRPLDLVARYGGEEFVVLLPDTDAIGATYIATQICAQVRALAIPHLQSQQEKVTISVGVATVNPCVEAEVTNLIEIADQALYQAKREGRDRFCLGPTHSLMQQRA